MYPNETVSMEELIEHAYCELLVNVRSISISASLASGDAVRLDVLIADERVHVIVKYAARESSLLLPGKVSSSHPKAFVAPADKGHISLRLPLDEATIATLSDESQDEPWMAAELSKTECGHCCECNTDIIRAGAVRAWKDLPSENWAEMMDFWHCHKPDVRHGNGAANDVQQKGYSAFNRLTAQAGTAMVDVSHVLLSEEDCVNLTVGWLSLVIAFVRRRKNSSNKKEALPDIDHPSGGASDTIAREQRSSLVHLAAAPLLLQAELR